MDNFLLARMIITDSLMETAPDGTKYTDLRDDVGLQLRRMIAEIREKYNNLPKVNGCEICGSDYHATEQHLAAKKEQARP